MRGGRRYICAAVQHFVKNTSAEDPAHRLVFDVGRVRFSILCCTHTFLCPVMSYCSDLGPDCTGSVTAWTLHLLCAGKHIRHLPSLSLVVLLVPDCVWNHLLSLRY